MSPIIIFLSFGFERFLVAIDEKNRGSLAASFSCFCSSNEPSTPTTASQLAERDHLLLGERRLRLVVRLQDDLRHIAQIGCTPNQP